MTSAEPLVMQGGEPGWLLRGPELDLPGSDLWTLIAGSLRSDASIKRLHSKPVSLTGGELLDLADRFVDLPSGGWVAVNVARSAAMVAAVLAIWSRGSAYVPLPTDLPEPRLLSMVKGCRPDAIITDGIRMLEGYEPSSSLKIAGRDLFILRRTGGLIDDRTTPCYVAHTSGTSGTPKAVRVSGRALLNRMMSMRRMVQPTPADRVLFKTSLAFDVHIWEFVFPLIAGCTLVVYDQERFFDLRNVAALMTGEGVTIAGFVPSLLSALLDRPDFAPHSKVRLMFCGGEKWTGTLARKFYERLPDCALRNSYGPAETTLAVSNWLVSTSDTTGAIEIGAPLDNSLYLVEEIGREAGVVTGMLNIGGAQVADGYVSAPDSNPFFSHAIDGKSVSFYRTGDVVELHTTTGAMVFKGRFDHQVKLNGVRIELGEVEAAIQSIEEIEACAVVLLTKTSNPCLMATYKTVDNLFVDPARVRKRCAEMLPATHVPAYFREVENYTLNTNGKIDRSRIEELLALQS